MNLISPNQVLCKLVFCFVFALSALAVSAQSDKEWLPIPADQQAAKESVVEKGADAEALLWEVRIDDSGSEDLVRRHYVRVKIFTELGREKFSKFDIPYTKRIKIKDLAARIVRPDGTSVEIAKTDIFDREIVKAGGTKVKAKSFAVPNIEPGVIVEYRYKEVVESAGAKGLRLEFQKDIPVRELAYYLKPYNSNEPKYQNYNFTDAKFVKDEKGYWVARRRNIPAFNEEPRMPPEDTVRPWMLLTGSSIGNVSATAYSISFSIKDPSNPSIYWAAVSADNASWVKFITASDKNINKLATEITAGAVTSQEKLHKLYEYCQSQIVNTHYSPLTEAELKKLPKLKKIGDVFERKAASGPFIDMAFGALASSLGFEVNVAFTSDKSEILFNPNMANDELIHPAAIAVKADGKWKLFNPGVKFLLPEMLTWYEEGNWTLMVGEKAYAWKTSPALSHSDNLTKRTGRFDLAEDGTLEGTVSIEYTGQPAFIYRNDNYDETQSKLEDNLREEIKAQFSTAEISNVSITNLLDVKKPLVNSYKIKIPGYAAKTGKRLFFQPGVFEYGQNPVFSSSSRKYDVFFKYPWAESDNIEINLPKSFSLDNADVPTVIEDDQKISFDSIKMRIDEKNNKLLYSREFYFGRGNNTWFPVTSYPILKRLFDSIHKNDSHTITIKQN